MVANAVLMSGQCPNGHRLRGMVKLLGKAVKCPKCDVKFAFGVDEASGLDDRPASNTRNASQRHVASAEAGPKTTFASRVGVSGLTPVSSTTGAEPTARCRMRPREGTTCLSLADTVDEIHETISRTNCDWYPVEDPTSARLIGIVRARDVISSLRMPTFELPSLMILPKRVKDSTSIRWLQSRQVDAGFLAFVVDESGSVVGLLTADDLMRF